jgi:hypothetical protein
MADSASQPQPWDRLPGEPNRWFSRFEHYRRAGSNRSLLGTVNDEREAQGKISQTKVSGAWNRAALDWHWKERAEAWDEHERQKAREAHAKAIEEMNQRHIQVGQAMQGKGIQRLKSLELDDISATEAARLLTDGTKLERAAQGEPEAIEERRLTGQGGGPLKFSLEDAVVADQELEEWQNERVQPPGDGALAEGGSQVP